MFILRHWQYPSLPLLTYFIKLPVEYIVLILATELQQQQQKLKSSLMLRDNRETDFDTMWPPAYYRDFKLRVLSPEFVWPTSITDVDYISVETRLIQPCIW